MREQGGPVLVGVRIELDADRRASLLRQERAFRAQLALARSCELPIVLHILRAQDAALRVLKRDGVPRRGGILPSTR